MRAAEWPPSENNATKTTCVKQEGVVAMKPDLPGALCACLVCLSGPVQAAETDAGLPVLANALADYYAVPSLFSPVAGHAPALAREPRPSPPALMADLGVPIDLGTLRTAESDGC